MEIRYPDSSRVGKFRILREVLESGQERPMLRALFSLCAKLREEEDETGRGRMFYMASPKLFQSLAEGQEIPEYTIHVAWPDQAFANPDHERDCLSVGGFRFKAVRQHIIRVPALRTRMTTTLH